MAAPKFITVKGSSNLTDKPYYYGLIQHESIMTKKETYEHLAKKLSFSEANIRAAFRALAEVIKANAAKGSSSYFDEVASVLVHVKGSFATSSGPWTKGKNYLQLKANELDEFKHALRGLVPVNKTGGLAPVIKSVLDNVSGIYDVIAATNDFTIAGTDLGPDSSKDDEYVGILDVKGELIKATIVSSDLDVVKAKFASPPTPGSYTLVVATRCGLGEEFSVKSATRKVTIA